jgi:peptidoglycan/LPS O-acetylase OafA/YrhL
MLMNNGTKVARLFANFFSHAGYGVDIFFALSGYLICTLLLREKQRNATISLPRFYVRRAFRILPPILLFLLIMVLLSHTGILPHIDTHEILAVLFFYRNYLLGSWYTGHFWSLAVEEQFYAVIPFFLLLANRQWAVRIASVLIALCIGIRWFEFTYGWFSGSILQFRTENRFDGLLWGCLFAMALQSTAIRAWLQRRLTGWIFLAMMAAVVVLLVAFNSQPARRTVVAAFMPFFIGYTVLHPASFAGRILELPLLKWVGRLSYSLYIWQSVFLVPDERPLRVLQAFPLNLVCPLVCASLSYYILEKPMIKIGHRLAASRGEKPTGRFD